MANGLHAASPAKTWARCDPDSSPRCHWWIAWTVRPPSPPVPFVGYSMAMETVTAPDLTRRYPSKGTKLGPARNEVWAAMAARNRDSDRYLDGRALAAEIA